MLKEFEQINNTLSEDLYEEAKYIYQQQIVHKFQKLPQMLHNMKIVIPETMMQEITRCLRIFPTPKFSFKAFTHYVARATLEEQLEDQIRNLFYHIDRKKNGKVDGEDLTQFLKQLQGVEKISDDGIECLFIQLDTMKLGYLNYEDLVYLLLPK